MMYAFRPKIDPWMLWAVVVLVVLGIAMVSSSSAPIAAAQNGDVYFYLKRQALFAFFGSGMLALGASIRGAFLEKYARPMLLVSLVLLILVLVPSIGHAAGGARRWIQVGPIGVQVGEIAKIAVVVHLCAYLSKRHGESSAYAWSGIARALIVPALVVMLLLCEPDFGTSVLILLVTMVLLFVGGARVGILAGLFMLLLPLAVIAISVSPYRMKRVLAFLDPWSHRFDIGYQITESLMTFGSGGVWGVGLGASQQKLFFLPAAHTDFILAVLGEELGFAGVAVVFACFALIAWRSLRGAWRARKHFDHLLIIGLSSVVVLQAFFNFAVVLGLVPTKGITLPFVSAGGSSLMMSMFCVGVLMRAVADVDAAAEEESSFGVVLPRFRAVRDAL